MSDGRLTLRLDAKQMEIRGPIEMNGVPTQIRWIENQSPGAEFQSRVTINTALSKGDWTELGAPMMDYYMTGPVPVEFVYTDIDRVTQYISLAANLHDARITVPELGGEKPVGGDGALRMRVQLDKDKPVRMSRFQLAAGDLVAEGDGVFDAEGTALKRFSLSKLRDRDPRADRHPADRVRHHEPSACRRRPLWTDDVRRKTESAARCETDGNPRADRNERHPDPNKMD